MITVHVVELRTEFTEIWRGSFSNFGRGTAGMDGFAGLTTFGNAEDRGVMCGPQTGTMRRSEERAVFPAMAGKERISITAISTSCSKKFYKRLRQLGEIVGQIIVGVAIQFLHETLGERRFTNKR